MYISNELFKYCNMKGLKMDLVSHKHRDGRTIPALSIKAEEEQELVKALRKAVECYKDIKDFDYTVCSSKQIKIHVR